jgi:hypothetical protein
LVLLGIALGIALGLINTKTKNGNAIFSLKNPYWV